MAITNAGWALCVLAIRSEWPVRKAQRCHQRLRRWGRNLPNTRPSAQERLHNHPDDALRTTNKREQYPVRILPTLFQEFQPPVAVRFPESPEPSKRVV